MKRLLNIACKEGPREVNAKILKKKIGGERFFYYEHNAIFGDIDFWDNTEDDQNRIILCEYKSGLKISEGATIEEAILTAQSRVDKYGKERFQEVIADNQIKMGIINL